MSSSQLSNAYTSRTLVLTLLFVLCISASVVDAKVYRYDATGEVSYIDKKSLLEQESYSSSRRDVCPSCKPSANNQGIFTFLAVLASFCTMIETVIRSFAFGFGVRLIKFVVVEKEEKLDKLQERLFKCAVMGLTIASLVLGLGIFIPARLQMQWFGY
jgi:hypothetical protein